MTPKEKAEELVGKYLAIQFGDFPTTDAKQCALIAVDELIKIAHWGGDINNEIEIDSKEYFQKVKQELEKI